MTLPLRVLGTPILTYQRLAGEIGDDLADIAALTTCPLLDGEQDVVDDTQGGAHTSDVTASPGYRWGDAGCRPECVDKDA